MISNNNNYYQQNVHLMLEHIIQRHPSLKPAWVNLGRAHSHAKRRIFSFEMKDRF